jgi:hypothetical protein
MLGFSFGALNVTDILKQSLVENDASTAPSLPNSEATLRWSFINWWKVEPQADDREPVHGAVAFKGVSPSAYRSAARRSHQASFKKWSQDRHD